MFRIRLHVFLVLMVLMCACPGRAQRRNEDRVAGARKRVETALKDHFAGLKLAYPPSRVFIRVFKRENLLELWAAGPSGPFVLVRTYPICYASGELGPKRIEGDSQVPEGFYRVAVFNPRSRFHLSLGIDYPNASDRKLSDRRRPGNAIMIHGSCVSIGCMAITDKLIEEVYLVAQHGARRGQKVQVHIFPTRLDAKGMAHLQTTYARKPELLRFWKNLEPGYRYFEEKKTLPRVTVNRDGTYRVGN